MKVICRYNLWNAGILYHKRMLYDDAVGKITLTLSSEMCVCVCLVWVGICHFNSYHFVHFTIRDAGSFMWLI